MNPKNMTTVHRLQMSRFKKPTIINDYEIKFEAIEPRFDNFWVISGITPFPKHVWASKDFNKINFEFEVQSGPYRVSELNKNSHIMLQRRGDYWLSL